MVSLINLGAVEPAPEVPVNVEMSTGERRPSTSDDQQQQQQQQQQDSATKLKSRKSRQVSSGEDDVIMGSAIEQELAMEDTIDEEQVKRILACKRLSEGCNRFNYPAGGGGNYICRKNSLHMQDSALQLAGGLPPVTEGEPMRHMSHHLSQNLESTSSSGSISSASFGLRSCGTGCGANRHAPSKRNSQDDNATSCSSSTSLDGSGGGPRSPGRRRSSTVSQCSSVLSEGTRQQLNFDLSPDLAPDSSILDANALSPTGDESFGRPASPEPMESPVSPAPSGGCSPFDLRAISRMSSQGCDELACLRSISTPDSTLGQSNEDDNESNSINHQLATKTKSPIDQDDGNANDAANSETSTTATSSNTTIRDNLERIISHVSAVRVSGGPEVEPFGAAQKRAHTPFGANLQRNKASHVSPPTPSPTAPPNHQTGQQHS